MTVIIAIEELEYIADNESIHVKGNIVSQNQFVQSGQFQSMDIG